MKSISGQLTLLSPVEDEVDSVRCPGIWRRTLALGYIYVKFLVLSRGKIAQKCTLKC